MNEHRDQIIDRVLRRGGAAPPPPRTSDFCLDGELLAAWTAGALPTPEAARIEEHVADCPRCQSMVALFVRTTPEGPPTLEPWWRHLHVRWLVPLAAAAIVAAVWVAVPERGAELVPPAAVSSRGDAELPAPQLPPSAPSEPSPKADERRNEVDAIRDQTRAQPVGGTAVGGRASTKGSVVADTERRARAAARAQSADLPATPTVPPAAAMSPAAPPPAPAVAPLQETVAVVAESPAMNARAPIGLIVSNDASTRWRIVGGTILQQSSDEGATWRAVGLKPPTQLTAGHSPAPRVLWLVGRGGVIYVSSDGANFERVPFVDSSDLLSVVAVNSREATVTTIDGRTLRTTDRGVTWISP